MATKNILVIPITWAGTTANPPTGGWAAVLTKTASFHTENSFGQLSYVFTLAPVLTIPTPASAPSVSTTDIANVRAAAVTAGDNPTSYDGLVFAWPRNTPFQWFGNFSVSNTGLFTGTPRGLIHMTQDVGGTWGFNDVWPILAHECGHLAGTLLGMSYNGGTPPGVDILPHSHSIQSTSTFQPADFTNANLQEYGNAYCGMGSYPTEGTGEIGHFSARQKDALGWMSGRTQVVSSSGSYTLSNLEALSPAHPQALIVTAGAYTFWLEYRQAAGFDSYLGISGGFNVPSGPLIYALGAGTPDFAGSADQAFILDCTPDFSHDVNSTNAFLPNGSTFVAPNGTTIQVAANTTTTTTLTVTLTPGLQIHIVSAGASTAVVQVTNPVAPTLVPQENLQRPGGVANLTVNTAASDSTHAALIWTHPISATGVTTVYRDGTQVAVVAAGVANYTDTVVAGSTHSYVVATNTTAGVGGPSSNLATYTASNPGGGTQPPIPSSGAYYGMTAAVRNGRTAAQELTYIEGATQANRQVTVIHRYHNWDNPPLDGYETGIAPPQMLSVNWFAANHAGTFATWPDIANGVYDSRITTAANSFASYGHPMWFCFHMEPENDTATCGTASDFVNAYRHVHSIVAPIAPNVAFVWNMIAATFRAGTQAQWYPGDSYVDWTAADGYNWYNQGGHSDPWRTLADIFTAFYNDSLTRNKPAMIAEYGTVDGTNGTSGALSKGDWFTLALATMKTWPNLKYAAYFNSQPFNTSPNWWFDNDPLGTTPQAYPRDKFKAISNDAYFTPLFGGGGGGGGVTSIATSPDAGTPGFYDPTFALKSHKGRVDDVIVANNVVYVAHSAPDVTDSGSTLTTVPNLTAYRRDTKAVKTAWHPSPNGRVYRLQPLGSSLVATGAFSTIGGQARGGIARFTPLSGASDTSGFALAATPGDLGADGPVQDVIFNAARTVAWVAGDFNNIGGSARRGVARFTIASDGSWTLDTAFNANIPAFFAGGGGRCVVLKPDETKLVFGAHPGNNGTDVHTVPSLLALSPTTGAGMAWANKIFYTLVANEHPGAFEMRGDAGGVYIGGLWNGGNSLCYFDWNGSGPNSVTIQANCNPTTASTSSVTTANCIWYFGCDGNVQTVGLVEYGGNQFIAAGHHGDVVALTKNHESGTAAAPGPVGNTTSHGLFLVTAGTGGGTLDAYGNPPSFGAGPDSDPLKLWAIYQDPASGDLHVGGDFTNVNSETNDLHRRYAVFSASGTGPPPPPPGDLTPPSPPANLDATAQSTSAIGLNWLSSTDNVGVTGYRIYRNGQLVGTVPGP